MLLITFYNGLLEKCLLFSDELTEKCFLPNIDYHGGDLDVDKKDTAEDCQLFCQQTKDCEVFTYITNSFKEVSRRRNCYLKNTKSVRKEKLEDVVSGPKFCAGEGTLGFYLHI